MTRVAAALTPARALRRLRGRQAEMEGNAAVLMASSLLTGALGIVYWVVAERFYPTAEVGHAAATISTATMLSSLACLSLGGSYQRFLPLAGAHSRLLIAGGIGVTSLVALALGAGFVELGTSSAELFDNALQRWSFPLAVVVLTAYALLDPILIGLRRPRVVAAKNTALSLLKLVPLPLLAFTGTGFAIAGSWAALALAVTLVVVVPLLRRGLADVVTAAPRLPPIRQLWAFQGASLTVTLVQTATPLCLPLIVLARLGGEYAAYYNLVAALGVAVSLLRSNVLAAYVVEASAPGAPRGPLTRRMIRLMVAVCLACCAGLAIGGPLLLLVAGEHYADAAIPLVLVMALETLVAGVTAVYAAVSYVSRRLRLLVCTQALQVVLTLGGALLLVPRHGLVGVGLASLCAQAVSGGIVALPLVRQLRRLGMVGLR